MQRHVASRVYLTRRFVFSLSPRGHNLLVLLAGGKGEPMAATLRGLVRRDAREARINAAQEGDLWVKVMSDSMLCEREK